MAYNGYNQAKKECNERYLAKFTKTYIRMTKEEHEKIVKAAELAGKSFNRYVIDCAIAQAKVSNE